MNDNKKEIKGPERWSKKFQHALMRKWRQVIFDQIMIVYLCYVHISSNPPRKKIPHVEKFHELKNPQNI